MDVRLQLDHGTAENRDVSHDGGPIGRAFGVDGRRSPSGDLVRRSLTIAPPVVATLIVSDDLFEYAIAAAAGFAAVLAALPLTRVRAVLGVSAALFILSAVASAVDIDTRYGVPGPTPATWLIIGVSFGALLISGFMDLREAHEAKLRTP